MPILESGIVSVTPGLVRVYSKGTSPARNVHIHSSRLYIRRFVDGLHGVRGHVPGYVR